MSRSRSKSATDQRPFTMVYNDFLKSKLLSPEARLIFIYLRMHSDNQSGQSFPSLSTLAKEVGLSKSTVQRCLFELSEKKVIKVDHRKSKNGYLSNLYTIYDTARIWNAENDEELKKAVEQEEIDRAIRLLKTNGFTVTKKGLTSDTDQSTETSSSCNNFIKSDNTLNSRENQEEKYSMDYIHDKFEYVALVSDSSCDRKDVDAVMTILYDILNSNKSTIRIDGSDKPTGVVIKRLLELTYEEILYSIEKYNGITQRIDNPISYMLSILYKSKHQMNFDINNQVQYNFYTQQADDTE